MSQVTTLGWPFERDLVAYAAAGVPAVGVSVQKLEQYGVAAAARGLPSGMLSAAEATKPEDPPVTRKSTSLAFANLL